MILFAKPSDYVVRRCSAACVLLIEETRALLFLLFRNSYGAWSAQGKTAHLFLLAYFLRVKHFASDAQDSDDVVSPPRRNKSPGAECLRQTERMDGKRPPDAILEKAMVALGKPRFSRDDYRLFVKVLRTLSVHFSVPSFRSRAFVYE